MRPTHIRPTADKLEFVIRNTKPEDCEGVRDVVCAANGMRKDSLTAWLGPESIAEQIRRFLEGQFVAVVKEGDRERVIGAATTMRTSREPDQPALRWMEMIGTFGLKNHDPQGEWLYGVEIGVDPQFQRRGVASALYRVRLDLVGQLGLRGWYAGGMLMGYQRYKDRLSPREYYRKVVAGEISDPTVSMQMHRGLKPKALIENYCESPRAGNNAVLLVWEPKKQVKAARKKLPAGVGPLSTRT